MKVYISVPITGHDMKIVRTWINTAKKTIINSGHTPVSPLDVAPEQDMPYSYYMGKDIEALLECEAIYLLRGWQESRGCNLEFWTAKVYNKKIMFE